MARRLRVVALLDDLLQPFLLIDLDKHIRIDKARTQILGEYDPGCALSCAGHPDEGDIWFHKQSSLQHTTGGPYSERHR